MDYIVSARKYRPESFGTLIGQDNIARTLQNSIARGQLAHAYLFCGPRGVGKTTTARIFAKMINCSDPLPSGEPCGKCESCVSFAEGRSYCIYEMDAASNNSVDDIKDLIDKVRIPPQVGRYSVYIIDEVHMLSQQAFNAFLKTLEEPPEYAIFILATTEKHKILPTILSRCQTYDFNRISVADIVRNLRDIAAREGVTIDDDSLHIIAQKADGAMRDALTIFDQTVAFCGNDVKYADVVRNLNVLDYEYSFGLVENFLCGDYAAALTTFDEILAKGFNALHFIAALSSHFRDLLVAKSGGIDSLMELSDKLKASYREQAARCSEKFLYDALSVTTTCEQGYKAAVNQRLHIEFCLMRLAFLCRTPAGGAAVGSVAPAPAAVAAQASAAAGSVAPSAAVASNAPAGQASSVAAPATAPAAAAGSVASAAATVVSNAPAGPALSVAAVSAAPAPVAAAGSVAPTPTAAAPAASSAAESSPAPVVKETKPADTPAPATVAAVPVPAASSVAPVPKAASPLSGLSLKSIAAKAENVSAAGDESAADSPISDRIPSDDEIRAAWDALCELFISNPRNYNGLKSAVLEITEGDDRKRVRYSVLNDSLKSWLEVRNARIEQKFRELVGSRCVDLIVDVVPEDPSAHLIASPEDKAKEMMSKNPEVKEWVTDMGLEIK